MIVNSDACGKRSDWILIRRRHCDGALGFKKGAGEGVFAKSFVDYPYPFRATALSSIPNQPPATTFHLWAE
jgi:hypothetical protein